MPHAGAAALLAAQLSEVGARMEALKSAWATAQLPWSGDAGAGGAGAGGATVDNSWDPFALAGPGLGGPGSEGSASLLPSFTPLLQQVG